MVYVLDTGIYTRSIMRLKAAQGGVRHSSQMRGTKTRMVMALTLRGRWVVSSLYGVAKKANITSVKVLGHNGVP